MDTPNPDTLKHIVDRLKANDIAWFKDRFKAGDFAWLKDRLPEGGYTKLGEKIEAGDLAYVRTIFGGLDVPGFANLSGAKAAVAAAAVAGGAVFKGAGVTGAVASKAAQGVVINDDQRKKGAVWLLPVALAAALLLGFGLSRLGKDNTDVAATDTSAVAPESVAPATDAATTATAETAAAAPSATKDILDTAAGAGSFNTLGAAINAAGLTETLKGAGPFTVFAPTDDAFKALPARVLDALLKPENKETLAKILSYHVVAGKVMAADIKPGDVATVESSTVKLAVTGGKVTVNDANVTSADIAATNGVIHVIDKVLVPASIDVTTLLAAPTTTASATTTAPAAAPAGQTIVDVAVANGSFTTLVAAVKAAGLAETLAGPGPFTVFAPTDEAFKKLPAGLVEALLKPENKATLTKILTYHVISGKVMAADIKPGDVETVETGKITLATDGGVTINGSTKVGPTDVAASNGVIHVIDSVLVPADVDVAALLGGSAPTTTVDLTTTNKAGDATAEDLTVYFDSGSARINADGAIKVANAVKALSTAAAGTKVALVGRADKTGNAAANLALSKSRAQSVLAAVKIGLGDKAANVAFTTEAKGDTEQVSDLAFARRVTIEIAR